MLLFLEEGLIFKIRHIKRERKKADDIDIIHYDNLFDFSNNLIGKLTY